MKVRFAAAILLLTGFVLPGTAAEPGPENLALKAKASASSEYSAQYLARFAIDGVVQPVWDRYCIECHNEREAAGDVDLSGDKTDFFNVSYEILARKGTLGEKDFARHGTHGGLMGESPYTSWISTYNGEEANILQVTPKTWGSPVSKLTEIVLSGHPDEDGKGCFEMDQVSRRRVMIWIDLNVPYYHTSVSNQTQRKGCRRLIQVA